MKLNVGCGHRRLPGYTGIDVVERPSVDLVAPAGKIPLPDGCAEEVMAIHLVEHFYEREVPDLLKEWHRLLQSGGRLVLEMPDLRKAAANLLTDLRIGKHPDQAHMWAIYGDATLRDPYMMHKAGWWYSRLEPVVRQAGFTSIRERVTQFHPAGRDHRDFRLEAVKP